MIEDQFKFTYHVAALIGFIRLRGYNCTFGEAYRTPEQAEIYAKEGKGIKDSLHTKRLAIDLNIFDHNGALLTKPEDYEIFGREWERFDPKNRWGGYFVSKYGGHIVDADHFERKI